MKFRVTFEFDSSREAVAFLQGIDGEKAVEAEREQPTVTISSPEPAREIKPDTKTQAKRKAIQKAAAPQETPVVPQSPAEDVREPITQDAAVKALNDLYAAQGLEVSKDVLARHGVKRFGDLKPEQYGAFKAMCDQVMVDGKV